MTAAMADTGPSRVERGVLLKRLAQLVMTTLLTAGACFLSAGTLDWPRAWVYLRLQAAIVAVSAVLILRGNATLVNARGRIHRDAKRFDKVILGLYVVLLFTVVTVAGLDTVRYHWSSPLSIATLYWGILLSVLSTIPALWALMVKPFAEVAVRIQREREQAPVTQGPYQLVRHPMYTGVILGSLAPPLILGSAWAFLPAAATMILFVVRTALEDRTLRAELPGYREYAQRTRDRLLPRIW
jgi:protein-S-isoprenylcysteine O-methyltransferase Ste14